MLAKLHRLFIPSRENGYAPSALQRVAMMTMAILIAITFAAANIQSVLWQFSDFLVATILPGVIVERTNYERTVEQSGTLMRSETLDAAARLKARHMATHQYFSHFAPDGTSPWFWFSEVNYRYVHAGENLAIHFVDSNAIVDAWMNSPSHRANIVDPKFTEIGIGTARGTYEGFDTVYVVQLFGTPAAFQAPQAIDNDVAVNNEPLSEVSPVTAVLSETTSIEPGALQPIPEVVHDIESATHQPVDIAAEKDVLALVDQETEIPERVAAHAAAAEPARYLETLATTVPGASLNVGSDTETPKRISAWQRMLTQPGSVLQTVYLILALCISMVLVVSIGIEIRHQHPLQIAYALLLLVAMGGLYTIHMRLIDGVLIA